MAGRALPPASSSSRAGPCRRWPRRVRRGAWAANGRAAAARWPRRCGRRGCRACRRCPGCGRRTDRSKTRRRADTPDATALRRRPASGGRSPSDRCDSRARSVGRRRRGYRPGCRASGTAGAPARAGPSPCRRSASSRRCRRSAAPAASRRSVAACRADPRPPSRHATACARTLRFVRIPCRSWTPRLSSAPKVQCFHRRSIRSRLTRPSPRAADAGVSHLTPSPRSPRMRCLRGLSPPMIHRGGAKATRGSYKLARVSFLASRSRSVPEGVGKPVRRREDPRLVTGAGCYTDDVSLPGQAYASMVRSPHAQARIVRVDTARALATPGVLAVLTGADLVADGLQALSHRPVPTNPHEVPLKSPDGSPFFVSDPLPLPVDRVRFVGEPVAMVVAETALVARDGAERVTVEWEPLPAVVTSTDAIATGAVAVWDACASNVAVETEAGDATATDAAFARAAHVVTLDSRINRVTGVPMEPRAAVGDFDASTGRYTVYAGSGGSWRIRDAIAVVLAVPPESVRVIAREVGGSYGTRNPCYPEYPLVAWAARRVRRPVKWTGDRRESLSSDCQARDLVVHAELALDASGTFLAYRARNTSNVGAHTVSFIPLAKGIGISTSVYHVPAASLRGRAVLSNTAPTSPYRAAGRPEIMYVIERLIDLAARRHGFDRIALRRKNLVPSSAMPYRNPVGLVYDSGDYAAALDRLIELSDWKGFESRRADARRRGRYRGIGFAHYIELNTGDPRERAEITVRPEGRIDVVLGTLSTGQGHETSFPQLIAEWFGVEHGNVKLITGDTDLMPVGGGTASGRSMRLGAVVMAKASDQIVEKGRRIAASLLEAAEPDIEFARRRFTVKGTDRSVDLFETAAAAVRAGGPLAGACTEVMPVPSYPYGCAVSEVEVDPDTGLVDVVRHTTVDDVGRAVNPLILHGQAHGGIAAGVGQALWGLCAYDESTGQLAAATLMDYALPRADALPSFVTELSEVPSTSNPLGLRGGGEGGTTPALGAVVNAVVDALAEFGVQHLDMPVTPERVWRAIHGGHGDGT